MIHESDLVMPAIAFIAGSKTSVTTTQLIDGLRGVFRNMMTQQDTKRLKDRNDDAFSQRVRNLKSHDTIIDHVCYIRKNDNGYWTFKSMSL